jgi:hypothetical protein
MTIITLNPNPTLTLIQELKQALLSSLLWDKRVDSVSVCAPSVDEGEREREGSDGTEEREREGDRCEQASTTDNIPVALKLIVTGKNFELVLGLG